VEISQGSVLATLFIVGWILLEDEAEEVFQIQATALVSKLLRLFLSLRPLNELHIL
jgi:hypothetical protein